MITRDRRGHGRGREGLPLHHRPAGEHVRGEGAHAAGAGRGDRQDARRLVRLRREPLRHGAAPQEGDPQLDRLRPGKDGNWQRPRGARARK